MKKVFSGAFVQNQTTSDADISGDASNNGNVGGANEEQKEPKLRKLTKLHCQRKVLKVVIHPVHYQHKVCRHVERKDYGKDNG